MKSETRHRIFLVDDHPVVLQGLSALLTAEPDLEVCGTSQTARDALVRLPRLNPELAIVDIAIGGVAGLDLIQDIKIRHPAISTLCFSVHEELFFAERALRAGAMGYVMKTVDSATVVRAVHTVLRGQVFLSDVMSRRVLNRLAGGGIAAGTWPIARLSNRELQVIHHIGASRDNRQIARLMSVSVKTVEAHRSKIKEKLKLRTTCDLIRFATHWVEQQATFTDCNSHV